MIHSRPGTTKIVGGVLVAFVVGGIVGVTADLPFTSTLGNIRSSAMPENTTNTASTTGQGTSTTVSFVLDVYDIIESHYWKNLSTQTLTDKFLSAIERTTGIQQPELQPATKQELGNRIASVANTFNEEKERQLAITVSNTVLQNLEPQKRSALYTPKKEKQLAQRVENVDPDKSLYASLGLESGAPIENVERAYQKKKAALQAKVASGDEEARAALEKVEYAYRVLSNARTKKRYDNTGSEPTVFGRLLPEGPAYLQLTKFSSATPKEFRTTAKELYEKAQPGVPHTLIVDLRDNAGGAIDVLPSLLGHFIGNNEYAFSFYSRGNRQPFQTESGWIDSLVPYKQVVVLINGNTQSSGEVMAATLKKYNAGVLVGTRTKGWGTIERTFQIPTSLNDTQYSAFLVHSVTLRPNEQPIEGNGIAPDVSVNNEQWRQQLSEYYPNQSIISAVADLLEEQ